jgi:hypothetical protein
MNLNIPAKTPANRTSIKRIAIPAALVTDSPRPLMQVTQANIEKMIGFMVLISMTKQRLNV